VTCVRQARKVSVGKPERDNPKDVGVDGRLKVKLLLATP